MSGNGDITYAYKTFSIHLPAGHLLPAYQEQYRLYDRFLPYLASMIEPGAGVVDVGANCGDTLAAMFDANPRLKYLCIEPDEVFHGYLERNIALLRETCADAELVSVRTMIGKSVNATGLEGVGGTKHAVVGQGARAMPSRTLDDLLPELGFLPRLLKSDVDGFDYDVIASAESTISRQRPILFFECQVDQLFQKSGYLRAFRSLAERGYRFGVFDNFGEFLCDTGDLDLIGNLIEYMWRQKIGKATRTFYYYDIVAMSNEDREFVMDVIQSYRMAY